jgi:hypothetical protein
VNALRQDQYLWDHHVATKLVGSPNTLLGVILSNAITAVTIANSYLIVKATVEQYSQARRRIMNLNAQNNVLHSLGS